MVLAAMFVLSMAVGFLCVFTDCMPLPHTVLGVVWILAAVSAGGIMAYCLKSLKDSDELVSGLYSRISTLSQTMVATESDLSEKNGIIAEYKAETDHLTEINNSYKQQLTLLRNEVASGKIRLGEYRQIMEQLRDRAELGDSLKAAFVANIHDEMRNPLNVILGYLSLISGNSISEDKRREYIANIQRDTTRFLDTVNDLFYYAKLVSGDIDINVSTFNIMATINTAVSMARQSIESQGKDIEVRVLVDDAGVGFIRGFEAGFVKILGNLLSNAVKFTPMGHIDVSCHIEAGTLHLAVEDTGIGFDSDKRDLIFGGFYQIEYYLTRKYGGTGLGLSICRALARLMNGNITAESHKGLGSRFCLEVPLIDAAEAELDLFARADRLLLSIKTVSRVMMITPFNEDFDFVSGFFAHYGVPVMRSNNQEETEALLAEFEDIMLVIIDLYSSSMEGVSAAESIFRMRPNVRFVFISNGSLNPAQIEMTSVYSDYILPKPLTSLALSKVLGEI